MNTTSTRTRVGKIARLPRSTRHELNCRLHDGEPGANIVEWLNALPIVQSILAAEFGGRTITEQNLSEWKQGGFADWLREEESLERVRRLTEHDSELDDASEGEHVSDRLGNILAAELAIIARALLEDVTDTNERWKRLREMLREVARLRRADHNAARLQMEKERKSAFQRSREQEEPEPPVERNTRCRTAAPLAQRRPVPSEDDDAEPSESSATLPTEAPRDAESGNVPPTRPIAFPKSSERTPPSHTQSNLIRPNPTNEMNQ